MATTSLGRLTLDLAVRLSEFSEGLSRAERETQERTRQMGESVSNFRQRVMDELGGTPIGGVIDSLNDRLGSLSGGGLAAGGALAGMAVGGVAVAAGALTSLALETAKADVELQVMANTANTSLKSFQVLTYAAAQLGVEQDALAGILADTQEKLGEFSATGGGGAADFFEALQNNTEMTDEQIRELGKTLQGKDGAEAIQLIKDKMDALGATSQEQRFVFESLAGDLGNLMPLFADGGKILNEYGKELEDAGVIKTKESIEQSRRLTAQTQAIQTRFDGFKTQLAVQMMPVLNNLIGYFVKGDSKGGKFGSTMESVGLIARTVGAGIISVATGVKLLVRMIQAFGEQVANIGITTDNFLNADGFMAKARALKEGAGAVYDINARLGVETVGILADARSAMTGLFEPVTDELSGLAGALYKTNGELDRSTSGLATNTAEAEANAKAQEKQTKAISNQMMVYKAWRSAGLSDNQARIITAEVGRENDYQDRYLFGGHSDPANNEYNLGMISWQKERGEALHDYLKELGLIQNNQIVKTQEALNAQAMFALKEMTENSRFDRTKKQFLANSEISYDEGVEVLGNNYIAWRYKDPKYASHHKRRDNHYNKLNLELGNADISKTFAAEEKAAAEALRLKEEVERRKLSISDRYATEREKVEAEHIRAVSEIESLYAEGSAERAEYLAREEESYIKKKTATAKSILESYMDGEEKLTYEHNQKIKAINAEFAHDDTTREMLIDLQKAAYQEDLDNFRFAANQKKRAQDKLYQTIADSARTNGMAAIGTGLDSMAQRTMSDDDYAVWRLAQDHDEAYNSVNDQYVSRQAEINARDERGNFELPELERFELLEVAKQEHLDKMWAMEQEHATRQQALNEQIKDRNIAIYSTMFGSLTGLTKSFGGEQSTAYRVMFAVEKGFAIAQSIMAIQQSVAKAMAVGFPANIPLIAQSVAQGAQIISSIKNVKAPAVAGIAHGGLENVPKESTYFLDKGERVLSPRQNTDLTRYLSEGGKARAGNITINNNSSAEVTARRNDDGTVTIDMVDKMIKRSFGRIADSNSFESKQIQRHTTARVKR